MSKPKIIDRALEWRLAGGRRSSDMSRAYQLRLKAPRKILDHVEAAGLSSRERLEARRMFLVCACAAFESYWRDAIRWIVDTLGPSDALIRSLNKQSFSFADLKDVLGHRLHLSELAACSYTFQHPDAVNRALSDCLATDAFAEFAKTEYLIEELPRKNRKSKRPLARAQVTGHAMALRKCAEIERCFRIRHEVVHHTGQRYRPTLRGVLQFENALWSFNEFLGLFVQRKVRDLKRQSNKPKQSTRVRALSSHAT